MIVGIAVFKKHGLDPSGAVMDQQDVESIVRDLVVSQLEGTISMETVPTADGGGTRVAISVPVRAPR